MNSDCKHENFAVIAEINRFVNDVGDKVISFVGKFAVHCSACGQRFEFASPRDAVRSLDREQLSIVLKPSSGIQTSFITRVHIADAPIDGKQKCFRCDTVLAKSEGEWHSPQEQTTPRSSFWPTGRYVGIIERRDGDPTNPRSLVLMDHDAEGAEEIHCNMPF